MQEKWSKGVDMVWGPKLLKLGLFLGRPSLEAGLGREVIRQLVRKPSCKGRWNQGPLC